MLEPAVLAATPPETPTGVIPPEDAIWKRLTLAVAEISDCQRALVDVLLAGPDRDNVAKRGGILSGLERARALIAGHAHDSEVPASSLEILSTKRS